jgi:hypothetical protein
VAKVIECYVRDLFQRTVKVVRQDKLSSFQDAPSIRPSICTVRNLGFRSLEKDGRGPETGDENENEMQRRGQTGAVGLQ